MATKIEQRTISGVQLRATSKEEFALVGIAASYYVKSKPIPGGPAGVPFVEQIMPGAFDRSLRSGADVKCLFNHDANYVMGRTKNRSLTLSSTPEGLAFRCQLIRGVSMHESIYAMVARRDIDACSFAFIVAANGGEKWNRDYTQRTLTDVDLFDVSVVTNPAYDSGTSVDARSAQYVLNTHDAWKVCMEQRLAQLAPVIAADKAALAAEAAPQLTPWRKAYLDLLREEEADI